MVAMVGRSKELAVIDDALSGAANGRGCLLLTTGEAGIGKTLLGQRTLERARELSLQVSQGHAVDDPGAPVLWPWRRASRYLPELAQLLGDASPTILEDDANRFALWEAITEALSSAARQSGLLLLLEDLHWADSLSITLLRHVVFDLAGAGVAVLATARNDPGSPFTRILPDLLRSGVSTLLPLSRLTLAEVEEWLSSSPETASWAPLADDLTRLTDGNPFYLRVLTEQGPPGSDGLRGLTSGSARTILIAPLLQLPEGAHHTITTAALIAERLSPSLLAAATGRTVTQVSQDLTLGVRAGLLQHGPNGLAFVHALVRDAVIAHADPDLRATLEASIATAMQAAGDDSLIGPIAAHWDRADGPGAAASCRDAARLAADGAAATHAHDEAVAWARMSVRNARRLGSQGADLAERLVHLANLEWGAGLVPAAINTCVEAADVADAADRADLMARAALVAQGVGSPFVARIVGALCKRALERVPDDDMTDRARLASLAAVAAAEDGVDDSADAMSAAAVELARRSGSVQAELEAIAARHYVLSYPQAIDERVLLTERALHLGRASTGAMGFLWGHLWQADIDLQPGDLGSLDAVIEQIGRLTTERSSPVGRWHEHRLRALRAVVRGSFDEGRREAEASLRIGEHTGDPSLVGMYLAMRVSLALLRGDPAEMPAAVRTFIEQPPPLPVLQGLSAQALVMLGERDRAAAVLDTVRRVPELLPLGPRWMGSIGQIGLAAAALDDAELASRCYELLAPTARWYGADGGGAPFYYGSSEHPLGVLAAAAGALDKAERHFQRALVANLRIGARPYVALARLGLAECLTVRADGRPTHSQAWHARQLLETAAEEFRVLDMPGPSQRAERLLVSLRSAARPAHGLTRRELEVAQLVAQAQSNQQIADRLFLSVRTVESHVRSALAKLHFSTRTELALWFQAQTDPARKGP